MKILLSYWERKQYPDCPETIPDALLNEEQAQRNHGQTLKRLNERGGLGPCEAIAIIERRRWHKMDTREAIDQLKTIVEDESDIWRDADDELTSGGMDMR